ncbi:unnamed protein product [Protopolystoma xenopodis]|uniref:Uncharacterized protein n=1 Tax=Protopolystoma xenopodis TaxID=117903 RepID=A0A3S5AT56_9PLAT|nr:unnamed protein product [Protopolystoma xenopodis]
MERIEMADHPLSEPPKESLKRTCRRSSIFVHQAPLANNLGQLGTAKLAGGQRHTNQVDIATQPLRCDRLLLSTSSVHCPTFLLQLTLSNPNL